MKLTPTQIAFLAAAKAHDGLFWNGHEVGWVGMDRRELTREESDVLHALTGSVTSQTPRALEKKGLMVATDHPKTNIRTIVWKAI